MGVSGGPGLGLALWLGVGAGFVAQGLAEDWRAHAAELEAWRYRLKAQPAEVWQAWCRSPPARRPWWACQMHLEWREGGDWQGICATRHPRFPPRYYRLVGRCAFAGRGQQWVIFR